MNRCVFFLFAILLLPSISIGQWEFVGNPDGVTAYDMIRGVLKFQPNSDVPHIFYQNVEVNVASEISMQRFNGSEWEYVGGQIIDDFTVDNSHLDFDFDPTNANVPIIYFHNGQDGPPSVAKLSGDTWEPLLGLSNFSFNLGSDLATNPISYFTTFGFDVGPTGNPVIGFSDNQCINEGFGNPPGNMSAIIHDGEEWQYLGQFCISPRTAGNVDLEYSPVTNELFGYNKGGEEQSKFDQYRVLEQLNGSQWDHILQPAFDLPNVVGHMRVNPVTGNVFIFDWGYEDGLDSERQFKVYEWDGTSLDSLHENNDLNILNANWLVDFHPITGEMHILFAEGADLNIKKHDGTGWVDTPFSDISQDPNQNDDYVDMEFNAAGELYILRGRYGIGSVIKHDGSGGTGVTPILTAESINLTVFPNPAKDEARVTYNGKHPFHLRLVNSMGQVVTEIEHVNSGHIIDSSMLAPGAYSICLWNEQTALHKRLIKE